MGSTSSFTPDYNVRTTGRTTAGVLPGRLQRTGYHLLTVAGCVVLATAVADLRDLEDLTGRGGVFLMSRLLMIVASVSTLAFCTGVLVPRNFSRRGRRSRVIGAILQALSVAVLFIPGLFERPMDTDTAGWLVLLRLVAAVIIYTAGAVLRGQGDPVFPEGWSTRLGKRSLWRREWLAIPLQAVAALWVLISIACIAILVRVDSAGHFDWYMRYVVMGGLALGVIGAALLMIGRSEGELSLDEQGHVVTSIMTPGPIR